MGEQPSSPLGSPTFPEGTGRYSVVIITAVIAAAAPLTVAIHECSSKSKEIELAERNKDRDLEMARRDQAFKTQSWFLQNAVDPQKTPELRQVLEKRLFYVLVTLDEPARRDFLVYLNDRFSRLRSSR
jgi:hypothetical protein